MPLTPHRRPPVRHRDATPAGLHQVMRGERDRQRMLGGVAADQGETMLRGQRRRSRRRTHRRTRHRLRKRQRQRAPGAGCARSSRQGRTGSPPAPSSRCRQRGGGREMHAGVQRIHRHRQLHPGGWHQQCAVVADAQQHVATHGDALADANDQVEFILLTPCAQGGASSLPRRATRRRLLVQHAIDVGVAVFRSRSVLAESIASLITIPNLRYVRAMRQFVVAMRRRRVRWRPPPRCRDPGAKTAPYPKLRLAVPHRRAPGRSSKYCRLTSCACRGELRDQATLVGVVDLPRRWPARRGDANLSGPQYPAVGTAMGWCLFMRAPAACSAGRPYFDGHQRAFFAFAVVSAASAGQRILENVSTASTLFNTGNIRWPVPPASACWTHHRRVCS